MTPTKKRPWLVRIDFLDHCASNGAETGLVPCTVWGLLVHDTPREVHVLSWLAFNSNNHNSEVYCLLKHKGMRVTKIRREKV